MKVTGETFSFQKKRKGALSMRAPKGGERRTKIISKGFISNIANKIFLESQAVVK